METAFSLYGRKKAGIPPFLQQAINRTFSMSCFFMPPTAAGNIQVRAAAAGAGPPGLPVGAARRSRSRPLSAGALHHTLPYTAQGRALYTQVGSDMV